MSEQPDPAIAALAAHLVHRHYHPSAPIIAHDACTLEDWTAAWRLARQTVADIELPPECRPRIVPSTGRRPTSLTVVATGGGVRHAAPTIGAGARGRMDSTAEQHAAARMDAAWLRQRLDRLGAQLDALRDAGGDRQERERILAEMEALVAEMEALIRAQRRALSAGR